MCPPLLDRLFLGGKRLRDTDACVGDEPNSR